MLVLLTLLHTSRNEDWYIFQHDDKNCIKKPKHAPLRRESLLQKLPFALGAAADDESPEQTCSCRPEKSGDLNCPTPPSPIIMTCNYPTIVIGSHLQGCGY